MTTPSLEERMARLEGSLEQIGVRLGTIEQDVRGLRTEVERVNDRIDRLMYWQLGLMIAIGASIVTVILRT